MSFIPHAMWSPAWRESAISELRKGESEWDLIVVGGGITGAGIYREAVKRGLRTLLIEQQDFAWGTSSRSSKMVHGGLRYLGSGQFGLANDSVKERQKLMQELPGLVNPLPFLMGHYKGKFPGPWIFGKLLAVYDWMAGQRYRRFHSKGIQDYWAPGLNTQNLKGVTQFADAVTDDARLVMRVLHEANLDGGVAINYLKAVDTLVDQGQVKGLSVEDQESGAQFNLSAKVVVNATGAWTDNLRQSLGHHKVIRPLRGSHLVLPFWRLPVSFSISFFHPADKRPVFVFPWEGVTVIGTTDLDHQNNLSQEAAITEQEVDYLLEAANHQFSNAKLSKADVRSTWSGVRPVVSNNQNEEVDTSKPSDEKREHAIWDDNGLISVAGGKLTTYRLIALDVLKQAKSYLGTDLLYNDLERTTPFVEQQPKHSSITSENRLAGRYGRHTSNVLDDANAIEGVAGSRQISTCETLWSELIWSCKHESVVHLDDLLLRRTRIALLLEDGAEAEMDDIQKICQQTLQWSDQKWRDEWVRYRSIMMKYYSLPRKPSSTEKGEVE